MFVAVWVILCFVIVAAESSAQSVIHVPADRPTIQAGIDVANSGDMVFVSPGLYNENIDFHGKAITVTSGAGSFADAGGAIINGVSNGPVVRFSTGETSAAVLNGFTVQGGHFASNSSFGIVNAGIFIGGASPLISNNIIQRNIACGVLVDGGASPTIAGNDIRENRAPLFDERTLNGSCGANATAGTGLAINYAKKVTVSGNTIEDNTISGDSFSCELTGSAGIFLLLTEEVVLTGNTIRNNSGCGGGNGLMSDEEGGGTSTLIMVQNRFYGNTSTITATNSEVQVTGSLTPPYPTIIQINNTFTQGSHLYYSFAPGSLLQNNVYYEAASSQANGLTCSTGPAMQIVPIPVLYNDIFGANTSFSCVLGSGDLAVDPEFANLVGGDLHTQPSSPVIYAGDINAPDLPPTDLDGKNRTVCGKIDMGVYQHHPHPPIALSAAPNPTPGRSAVTLTATLTGNCNTPTGAVTFFDGATVLGTATLGPGAVASFTTSFLFVGTHTLTATYPGDFNFEDSTSNAVTEVITGPPTTTVLTIVAPNPALPFQPVTMAATVSSAYTVPAGTITFFAGATPLTTVPVAANGGASAVISTLGAGTYAITARYSGSTEYGPSTSNAITLVVLPAPSVTTLTAQPNPIYQGQTVTLAASSAGTSPSRTAATGTMSFFDGGTLLGAVPVLADQTGGHATLATSALAVGSHPITAAYSGDANLAPSTSSAVIEVVLASSFTIGLSPANLTFGAGLPQQITVNLASIGNYTGTLQLTTGMLPQYAAASFSPATVQLTAGGSAVSTLTLLTTSPLVRAGVERKPVGLLPLAAVAGLPLLLLRRFRRLPNLLAVLVACAALASLAGCGSVRFAANSVAPGTYVIPITATDAQTKIMQTANLTLQITR